MLARPRSLALAARGHARALCHVVDQTAVPILDVSEVVEGKVTKDSHIVKQIRDACGSWGFLQIQGHGVPMELIDQMYEQQEALFALPVEKKNVFRRSSENSKGWYNDELTKQKVDWKEGFDLGAQDGSLEKTGLDGFNVWPDPKDLPHFRPIMTKYFEACAVLSSKLVEAMALGMGLQKTYFEQHFKDCHSSYLRLNYYPECPNPSDHMAISHHTDAGALTVLTQTDVQSLQVWKGTTEGGHPVEGQGKWYDVKPQGRDTYVINTGDIVQVWSNDVYKAALHQVKTQATRARYSTPFFYNPSYETDYKPVAFVDDKNPAQYSPINWGKFRLGRFAGDYADVGEENQIAHYRTNQ